ncbi:MAG: hypothetical protein A2015_07230 [Spirochaetes bacterium GWF1_31_7]|nr:MAG: hypothetical protein A2Y30_02610 [Spirochaetes bacterium GWE1_32_154]OHD46817.1 MAG: hypothetical protein A2Y29_09775 [Spirochaetes bacterium GWE2_31_10]OHD51210.1 MAG: hypothetical protein A2015_07230 [Spirochaetes bacterium GWF1_31_7]OHD79247.1 MAG: hypothetical protein A2355_10805 [Spirochaetes bacterium RIFOXYB1_FULL_32_8]HBD95656.1 hypothetical protein [Spirochaetia bacterium]
MVTDNLQSQNDEIDFKKSLEETFRNYEENTIISATVDSINDEIVYLDFGGKSEAKIPVGEFIARPKVGDVVEVYLVYQEGYDGDPVVSLSKAKQLKEKDELYSLIKNETVLEGDVVEVRKYGVMIKYGSLHGFVPLALWDVKRTEDSSGIKEKKISFVIDRIAIPRDTGGKKQLGIKEDFVANRKKALLSGNKQKKSDFFETAKEGDVVKGTVKNITDFGAFIDIGGVEGLLHIKEISWNKVDAVSDVLKVGDVVDVKIISIKKDKQQIGLGMKYLTEQPWDKFIKEYKVDSVVKGTVTSLMPYGAFVKIIDGVEALLHISDMSWIKNVKHPKELLTKGQSVEVKIQSIDEEHKKINVSLKHLLENPWDIAETKYQVGTKVSGRIKSVTSFGAFVELEEGVDALLYKDEISWTEVVDPVKFFKEGETIEAEVLQCDVKNNKIKLGVRQLSDDPWKNIPTKLKQDDVVECEIVEVSTEKGLVVKFVNNLNIVIGFQQIAAGRIDEIKQSLASDYKVGNKVNATIRNLDLKKRVIELSIRDYEKAVERKSVKDYLVTEKDHGKFTLADHMKSKND